MKKPIVFIGPPASGKSSICLFLAQKYSLPFVDIDKEIEAKEGEIFEIFLYKGQSYFRNLETNVFLESIKTPKLIALGAGGVLNKGIQENLHKAFVVFLDIDINDASLKSRILSDNRPLLKNGISDLKKLYNKRLDFYKQYADLEIYVSYKTIKEIAEEIYSAIKKYL